MYRKASLTEVLATQAAPSEQIDKSCDIALAAPRRENFYEHRRHTFAIKHIARTSFATQYFDTRASWSGHGGIAWLLPLASPTASTYAPPRECYVIPCAPIPSCVSSASSNTPRHEETLSAPLCNCRKSRSKWVVVRFCCTRSTNLGHSLPLPSLRSGWERWESIRFTASKISCRSRFQAFQCLFLGGG